MNSFFHSSRLYALLIVSVVTFSGLDASWRPSESAAVFTAKPNQITKSAFYKEILSTYGLLGVNQDPHWIAFQKDMGIAIEQVSEVTVVFDRMMEVIYSYDPKQSIGQLKEGLPAILILNADREVSPGVLFERFKKWASGPMWTAKQIENFKQSTKFSPEKIAEMSTRIRIPEYLFTGMDKVEEYERAMLFSIPLKMMDEEIKHWDVVVGVRAENGFTNFAVGMRKGVKDYFSSPESAGRRSAGSSNIGSEQNFSSFVVPVTPDLLQKMGADELSEPTGPLGPLANGLGGSLQKVRELSGNAKFSGTEVHLDMVVRCSDSESAQALWSVGQASLGMSQLRAMRRQMKNPQAKPLIPLNFLNRIKLKHDGNNILIHLEALPVELFPWAVDRKLP